MHCLTDMQFALVIVFSFAAGSVMVFWIHRNDIFH